MLQELILRLDGLDNLADPIIVCNADHRFLVAEQCHQIGIKNPTILLEPVGRNTAPAIAAQDVMNYITMWYNSHRLNSYLGYKSPNQFEFEM